MILHFELTFLIFSGVIRHVFNFLFLLYFLPSQNARIELLSIIHKKHSKTYLIILYKYNCKNLEFFLNENRNKLKRNEGITVIVADKLGMRQYIHAQGIKLVLLQTPKWIK